MTEIDALYERAKADPAFLNDLVLSLMDVGKRIAVSIFKKYQIYTVTLDDVEDYILYLVHYTLENYKHSHKTFDKYARFVMYKRLTTKIIDLFTILNLKAHSLDELLEDGTPVIDAIPDNGLYNIPDDISFNEVKLEMSSPKATDSKTNRMQKRVFVLQNAGFSTKEIKKILNVNEDQLRYLIKLNNESIKELQFKIKIK